MSLLAVQGGATGTGTVTLLAPVTNTNRTLTLPDATGTVLTTATAGTPINGPAFSAYQNSGSQSVTASTFTKVQFNTEEFDTNSNYDNATNYRFTPTVAGYYQVNSCVACTATSGTLYAISLYKNGAGFKNGNDLRAASTVNNVVVSTLVYMNGSTDYLEVYIFIAGTTPTVNSGVSPTYFQAALVRSAI